MSDCLLDTHALMWAINEPSRLGAGAVEGDAALDRDPGRGAPAGPDARRPARTRRDRPRPRSGRRIGSGLGRCTRRPTTRVGSIAP